MTIKNIGTKIISIGTEVLMPDKEMAASKAVTDTPAIKAMVRKGFLSVTGDSAPAAPKKEKTEAEIAAEKAAQDAEKEAAESAAREAEFKEKLKAIKKMNRGELDQACAAAGIEVAEGDTMPTLQEKLISKLQNEQ